MKYICAILVLIQINVSALIGIRPSADFQSLLMIGEALSSLTAVLALQNRLNKLPPAALKFYTGLSAWTATLLFMWGPVAQAVRFLSLLFSFA